MRGQSELLYTTKISLNSNSNREEGGGRFLSRTGWVDKQEKPAELVSEDLEEELQH